MTMSLVSTVTVGSGGASSIEFTSIPQDGTDLVLLTSFCMNDTGAVTQNFLTFNGSTVNYSRRGLFGSGSSVSSTTGTTRKVIFGTVTTNTANTFSNNSIYVANYTAAQNKSFSIDQVTENNATAAYQEILAGLWSDTAAITTITITGDTNFLQHSTASLYKITKGSDGIVTTS
jgi:hypothetical protein